MWKSRDQPWRILGVSKLAEQMTKQQVSTDVPSWCSWAQSLLRDSILSWNLLLLCETLLICTDLGNDAFCWPYIATGTRKWCMTHPGLASFRTQSSDILRLFINHKLLQPTYRYCIILMLIKKWLKQILKGNLYRQNRDLWNWGPNLASLDP